jgi:hypothetical protein
VSVLVLGAGLFYLAVAVKGLGSLLAPPPEMVTVARDLRSGAAPTEATTGQLGTARDMRMLFKPLAVTGAALAALLLLWAGACGLRARRDRRRWRTMQITGLTGLTIGTFGFAIGLSATGSSVAPYVDAAWLGLEPVRPSGLLALLIGAAALARAKGPPKGPPQGPATGPATGPANGPAAGPAPGGPDTGPATGPETEPGQGPSTEPGRPRAPLTPSARRSIEARGR